MSKGPDSLGPDANFQAQSPEVARGEVVSKNNIVKTLRKRGFEVVALLGSILGAAGMAPTAQGAEPRTRGTVQLASANLAARNTNHSINGLRETLASEYKEFAANPTPEKGAELVRKILDGASMDEIKNSPIDLRAIGEEALRVSSMTKNASSIEMTLNYVHGQQVTTGGEEKENVFSVDEKSALIELYILDIQKGSGYPFALYGIDTAVHLKEMTLEKSQILRDNVLKAATVNSKNDVNEKINIAKMRLRYAKEFCEKYIESNDVKFLTLAKDYASLTVQLTSSISRPSAQENVIVLALKKDAALLAKIPGILEKKSAGNASDSESLRALGAFEMIRENWGTALDLLRQGNDPFAKTYGVVEMPDASQNYSTAQLLWKNSQTHLNPREKERMQRLAIHLFDKAIQNGLGGFDRVNAQKIIDANPALATSKNIEDGPTMFVSTTVAVGQTNNNGRLPVATTVNSNTKPPMAVDVANFSERKFAEQLLLAGAQITASIGDAGPRTITTKDLVSEEVVITGIAFNKSSNLTWMAYLGYLKNLTSLKVTDCAASDAEFAVLSKLSNLDVLSITNTNAGPQTIQTISKLPITILRLDGVRVNDAMLSQIADLQLTYLALYGTQITDQSVATLSKITTLKTLNVSGTKMTMAGIQQLQRNLPGCSISK